MNQKTSVLEPKKVLTIAGSDSGGAAGLQADLKTLTMLGAYGMSVVTVVTAQNSVGISAIQALPVEFVAAQLEAVLSDYGASAAKTGFIGRVDLIALIASKLRQYQIQNIVIDPVLVDHRHQPMFPTEVASAYRRELLPLADLVTPNLPEAALLSGISFAPEADLTRLEATADVLYQLGARHVLLKGGRLGDESVDIHFDGNQMTYLRTPWINTHNTHGSGDTLSAAVSAFLAQGVEMSTAIREAHRFTAEAIQRSATWHLGQGHGPVATLPS